MTQLQQVINQLEATGSVSRNWCLQRYNTRLGARINDLKRMGWKFNTTRKDGDYIYSVLEKPYTSIETPKPAQTHLQGLNLPSSNTYRSHYND